MGLNELQVWLVTSFLLVPANLDTIQTLRVHWNLLDV